MYGVTAKILVFAGDSGEMGRLKVRIIEYREGPFVDREKEEEFLLDRFKHRPEKLLFIYGPKSSGKTTLMEYLVENVLEKDKSFYVNYVNFRRYAIVNYRDFLDIYFKPIREEQKSWLTRVVEKLPLNLGLFRGSASLPMKGVSFGLNIELYNQLRKNEVDPFVVLMDILRNIKAKRQPILILDEVQTLQDIYMNGEIKKRHLLTEFFNFLVRLTKETHLAHVVVMTSETLFLEKLYNHSKLAKTSDFYKIDHFDKETVRGWFEHEGIGEENIFQLIWEYFGGAAIDVVGAIRVYKQKGRKELENFLLDEAKIYRGKISYFIAEKLEELDEKRMFKGILEEMLEQGFVVRDNENNLQTKVMNKAIEYEFLFLNPREERIVFNSQIVKKGAELLFKKG
jgi:AAA+ ATPase superfamily predicted ATPase